jgi:hypothetical protein
MNPLNHPLPAAARALALCAALLVNVGEAAVLATLAADEPAAPKPPVDPAPDLAETCGQGQRVC